MGSGSAKNDRPRVTARQVRAQGAKQARNTLSCAGFTESHSSALYSEHPLPNTEGHVG